MKKQQIAELLAKHRLRISRGDGLLSFVEKFIKLMFYFSGGQFFAQELLGMEIPNWVAPVLATSYIISIYFVGLLDEKYGFWKYENARNTKQLNPFFEKMELQIDGIAEKVGELYKKWK